MFDIVIWSFITVVCFKLCVHFVKKLNISVLNPILLTIIVLISLLILSKTSYDTYKLSTDWITFLLGPIVVMLAVPLYKSRKELQKYLLPIAIGILSSIVTSAFIVILLSNIFALDKSVIISLLPKSITTPMAVEVTDILDGVKGLTIVFVILTGVIGATLATWTLKLFRVRNSIAKGIGIGASSHGIGTSKAVEISEEVAAASGLSMGLAGVTTVIFFSIIANFL